MTTTQIERVRGRLTRDSEWMRRARRRYVGRLRFWLNADKERIYELSERMKAIGLYAPTSTETSIRCSILSILAWFDGCDRPHHGRRDRWLMQNGWHPYWGNWGSRSYRAKQRRRFA